LANKFNENQDQFLQYPQEAHLEKLVDNLEADLDVDD